MIKKISICISFTLYFILIIDSDVHSTKNPIVLYLTANGSGKRNGLDLQNAISPEDFNKNHLYKSASIEISNQQYIILLYDDHGPIKKTLSISNNFNPSDTITIKPGPGELPSIDASKDISNENWVEETNQGNNIWSNNINQKQNNIYGLWYNYTTWGVEKEVPKECISSGDWHYEPLLKRIYLFSPIHPSKYYTNIRVSSIDRGIDINNYNGKVDIQNIKFQYFARLGNTYGPVVSRWGKYLNVYNCIFEYYPNGIVIVGNRGGEYNVTKNTFRYPYSKTKDGMDQNAIRTQCQKTVISNNSIDNLSLVGDKKMKIGCGVSIFEGSGIADEVPANCKIINNEIKNVGWTGITCFKASKKNVGRQKINLLIERNTIINGQYLNGDYDGIGIGGHSNNISQAWKNIYIIGNWIDGFGNGGIHFANSMGSDSLVFQNVIINSGGKGYGAIRANGGAKIINNTIFNVYETEEKDFGAGIYIGQNGSLIYNNIIHTVTSGKGIYVENGKYAKGSNNIIFNVRRESHSKTFNAGKTLLEDPTFKSPLNNDFSLLPNSPAIKAGINIDIRNMLGIDSNIIFKNIDLLETRSEPDIGAIPYSMN